MEEEKMLVPSGLKTVDGKDIMCYTGAFYLKNEEKIKRIIKKCEEILDAESEDIISCKNKMEDFEYAQLEKIVKYELMGTENKEIISKFIEKIKNREESENIMMNAARIINKEIRKQRREGREEGKKEGIAEGMIFVAKKLKGKMHIKDISQITGLSEKEIEKL